MSKFQKAIKGSKYGFQLFSIARGEAIQAYLSDVIRRNFGNFDMRSSLEICLSYLDTSTSASHEVMLKVKAAVNSGDNAMMQATCRSVRGELIQVIICVKPIKDKKSDETAAFRF